MNTQSKLIKSLIGLRLAIDGKIKRLNLPQIVGGQKIYDVINLQKKTLSMK